MQAPITTVASLRGLRYDDREDRDVCITRPGPWGNQFSVDRCGPGALDMYREWLAERIAKANRLEKEKGLQRWLADFRALAGRRLLCACSEEAIRQGACHGAAIAIELQKLTGIDYELAPAKEDP